jgi:iron complex outermembrane receptor protein
MLLIGNIATAQQQTTVTGTVLDAQGQPLVGATVLERATNNVAITDGNGGFTITVSSPAAVLQFSFTGFKTTEIPASTVNLSSPVQMEDDYRLLDELVVIGYGQTKRGDLTGSITTIGEREFNKGVLTSPVELMSGKVAGVQITSLGGRPGSGNRIRIRGTSSLSATSDPLIVLDGVPLAVSDISGSSDVLSTINPNDIESMNVLKDASATAIYGSRASNGVIIITTKKGVKGQALKINFSTLNSISTIARRVDVMNAATFRELVMNNPFSTQKYVDYLGDANTDWQKEIYRTAFTTDNNLSVSGNIGEYLPFRISGGYFNNSGILKTDNMQRGSLALSLSPTLFANHLSVQVNVKGTMTDSFFGNNDAIGAAIRMDPTQPVRAPGFDNFNGYYTWLSGATPNGLATYNPVALLNSRSDKGTVQRSIGNIQLDYKFHFLPELRANLNLGYDISQGKGDVVVEKWAPNTYRQGAIQGGLRSKYQQDKTNKLLEFYLNYTKAFANSRLEVMGGYTYQDWKTTDHAFEVTNYDRDYIETTPTYPQDVNQNTLISFYGRLNYSLMDKYLLTASIRRDGSSRFSKDNRWGMFPSVALAWRISEEGFLKDVKELSNLKLRLGYGVTGQQEIRNYGYIPSYALSDLTAQYQWGNTFYQGWRPGPYDKKIKWEETATYNIGVDFGFLKNRLYGSIDYYHKDTRDLLNEIDVPMGSNFSNRIIKNIGSMMTNGYEISLNLVAIDDKDLQWDLGLNLAHNYSQITQLTLNDSPDYAGVATGGISGGTGHTVQMHSVGHVPGSFYLYKQLYYPNGLPIEGAFADLNGDGVINELDRYFVQTPEPDIILGFNTSLRYKSWSFATSLRANIGNYVYNNVYSDLGNFSQVFNPNNFLMNTVNDIKNTQFYNRNLLSDYYLSNASFLKMDYFQIAYDFGRIANMLNLTVNFSIQNVFTITKYKGVDPEVVGKFDAGIDGNFYPNPRIFSLGLNLNF